MNLLYKISEKETEMPPIKRLMLTVLRFLILKPISACVLAGVNKKGKQFSFATAPHRVVGGGGRVRQSSPASSVFASELVIRSANTLNGFNNTLQQLFLL